MATTQPALRRRRACNAVELISRTVRTLRQHNGVPRLLDNAIALCQRELAVALADQALTIELRRGEVRCAGQKVMSYGEADVPFGLLAEAGVGEIVLQSDATADELETLLRTCAGAPGTPDPDYDLAEALRREDLPNLELRPPAAASADLREADSRADWWLLPEPIAELGITRLIERELEANLPRRALDLLLADVQRAGDDYERPVGPLLEGLLDTMLGSGDAASAAHLLEQAEHCPEIPADTALRLRRFALQTYQGEWLLSQLEHEDRLQGLVSLGIQLGNDGLDRFTDAAHCAGVPLPPWVSSMLSTDQ